MDVRTESARRIILNLSEEEAQILANALGIFSGGSLTYDLYVGLVDTVAGPAGSKRNRQWLSAFTVQNSPTYADPIPSVVRSEDEDN